MVEVQKVRRTKSERRPGANSYRTLQAVVRCLSFVLTGREICHQLLCGEGTTGDKMEAGTAVRRWWLYLGKRACGRDGEKCSDSKYTLEV